MRKIALALSILIAATTVAQADQYRRHGYRPQPVPPQGYYHNHNRHYNGGNNNWVAPLVGGLIIGGIVSQSMQPRYYQQYQQYNEPVCERRVVAREWNGIRWVPVVETYCY